jgi:DNA-binding NarL/FixJ family response regulator
MHDQPIGAQPGSKQPVIRVALGDMPEVLLRMVAQAIHEQGDMVLVGEGHDPISILHLMRNGVDVVILGSDTVGECPGICSHLLSEYPHLKIVLFSHRENAARAYWLGVRQRAVSATTMQALLRGVSHVSQIDAMD